MLAVQLSLSRAWQFTRRLGVGEDTRVCEYLHMTVVSNHPVVGGASAASSTAWLNELVETAFCLDEIGK